MEYYSTEYHRGIELPLEVVVLYFCSTWQITRVNHGGRSKENQSKWQKKNCRSGHIHPLLQIYLHRLSLWHSLKRPGYQPPQVVRQQLGPQSQAKLRPSTPPPPITHTMPLPEQTFTTNRISCTDTCNTYNIHIIWPNFRDN